MVLNNGIYYNGDIFSVINSIIKVKRNLKVLGKNPYQSHGLEQNFPQLGMK